MRQIGDTQLGTSEESGGEENSRFEKNCWSCYRLMRTREVNCGGRHSWIKVYKLGNESKRTSECTNWTKKCHEVK